MTFHLYSSVLWWHQVQKGEFHRSACLRCVLGSTGSEQLESLTVQAVDLPQGSGAGECAVAPEAGEQGSGQWMFCQSETPCSCGDTWPPGCMPSGVSSQVSTVCECVN